MTFTQLTGNTYKYVCCAASRPLSLRPELGAAFWLARTTTLKWCNSARYD